MKYFLRDWGIELAYMVAGLFGSLVFIQQKQNRKRPKWEKFIIVLVGIVTANYLTPAIVWLLNVPQRVEYGISFVVGYMGLNLIGFIIDYFRDKFKVKKK